MNNITSTISKTIPLSHDISHEIKPYFDIYKNCIFCHEPFCIHELQFRPLFLAMGAFISYAGFDQSFLIEKAYIEINFKKQNASYLLNSDIILSGFNFDGGINFYFGNSSLFHHIPSKSEIIQVINLIESTVKVSDLENHHIMRII